MHPRSDLTSDLKSMAQTTYATMFVWTDLAVLKLFCIFLEERRRKKENLAPLDLSASPQVKIFLASDSRMSRLPFDIKNISLAFTVWAVEPSKNVQK